MAKLKIIIEGAKASGKSRLAFRIKQALEEDGHRMSEIKSEGKDREEFEVETAFIPSGEALAE